jgi:hypothetical protein
MKAMRKDREIAEGGTWYESVERERGVGRGNERL